MIEVVVPCSCPGTPHPQDSVSLWPVVDVRIGAAAASAMRDFPTSISDMEGALAGAFLHFGVRAWTFIDDKKEPLAVTVDNIDARLAWHQGGMEVVEKANELYAGDVFRPLVARMSKALPPGQTDDSTSATPSPGDARASSGKPYLHAVSDGKRSVVKAS